MCFAVATQIPCADGRDRELHELGALEMCAYSCSTTGRVVMTQASIGLDSIVELPLRIALDNGLVLVCGPSQELQLRDGSYRRADALTAGTSLMPFYSKRDKDGYVLVQQNYSGRWQKAHWIAARCRLLGPIPRFKGQRTVIHHKNFDPADNRRENLQFMGDKDHSSFHRLLAERNEYWQSPEFEVRRVEALAAKARTVEGHAYFADRGTKNIRAYMARRPDHFRASVAGNGKRGARVLSNYNVSAKGRSKSREMANRVHTCELCGEQVRSYIGLHNHRRWKHGFNHKVVTVEHTRQPVVLICVKGGTPDNIALSAGVFARTCIAGDR